VPLVEPCCPAQSVCHITVSRLMSERILNIHIYLNDSRNGVRHKRECLAGCADAKHKNNNFILLVPAQVRLGPFSRFSAG